MAAKEIGKIEAVCVSRTKGTAKQNIGQAILKEDYGMQGMPVADIVRSHCFPPKK